MIRRSTPQEHKAMNKTANKSASSKPAANRSASSKAAASVVNKKNLLTTRQRAIYDFIKDKIINRGYGPTVREIGTGFKIRSPNGVMCHLKALEKKGLIQREGFSARAIRLVDHRPPSAGLPLLGAVAAGSPVEAVANEERLDFDELFAGPDHFALQVRGQSMIEDH